MHLERKVFFFHPRGQNQPLVFSSSTDELVSINEIILSFKKLIVFLYTADIWPLKASCSSPVIPVGALTAQPVGTLLNIF